MVIFKLIRLEPRVRCRKRKAEVESGAIVSGLREANNSRIICAHPYRLGVRKVLPGNVWLDRKVGVVLGKVGFAEASRTQNVGWFGEIRMHPVQISCEAEVHGPGGLSP